MTYLKTRCEWCGNNSLIMAYHDEEWGIPLHDDKLLFEFLILEGAQAGLNWLTILKKRNNYRKAFDSFDYKKVANYSEDDIERLLKDSGIIRNRLKIKSAIKNAKAFIDIQDKFGSFDKYIWSFVNNKPIQNSWKSQEELLAKSKISEAMSKDLKKRGFNFVGPTICYAFMQAIGMVNDHTTDCYRYKQIKLRINLTLL